MTLHRRDEGAALITVVVLGFVLMVLIATGLTVATSGLRQAAGSQNGASALDAAYAGVQDYVERLNVDKDYVQFGNKADPFSASSDVTMPTGAAANKAFGYGAGADWAPVPGSTASFRYEVDTTGYESGGIVQLRVTGRSGDRTRTLLVSLRVKGFVDYVYFSDYEIADPAIFATPASCLKYSWQFTGGRRPASCVDYERTFGQNDIVYGDVHTNDTPIICGTTFSGVVETGWTTRPYYRTPAGCTNRGINAKSTATLPLPSTNTAMKQQAACVYTGPTQITYNANGTMTVVSPWTKSTRINNAGSNTAARCGAPASLASAAGATIPQLDRDLLYVQDVPSSQSDPNHWDADTTPPGLTCIAADGSRTDEGNGVGWTIGSGSAKVRYPLAGEAPAMGWQNTANPLRWNTLTPAYGCRNGDLYVSGRVTSRTTAASENYVYVTGDITYANRASNVLGLVGQNAVIVWNPTSALTTLPMVSDYDREIDAAVISVEHSFQVQNYARGATRGALVVFGSIAQKYRGPTIFFDENTGEPIFGYTKSYQYDTLLKTVSPPKFLEPSTTTFNVTRYATVPTAFTPTGAPTS